MIAGEAVGVRGQGTTVEQLSDLWPGPLHSKENVDENCMECKVAKGSRPLRASIGGFLTAGFYRQACIGGLAGMFGLLPALSME